MKILANPVPGKQRTEKLNMKMRTKYILALKVLKIKIDFNLFFSLSEYFGKRG